MNISATASASLAAALEAPDGAKDSVAVAMLDKANQQTEQQGAAMVRMIEQSVVDSDAGRLDAYA